MQAVPVAGLTATYNSPFLPQRWPKPFPVLIAPTLEGMARLRGLSGLENAGIADPPNVVTNPSTNRPRRILTLLMWQRRYHYAKPAICDLYNKKLNNNNEKIVAKMTTTHTNLGKLSQSVCVCVCCTDFFQQRVNGLLFVLFYCHSRASFQHLFLVFIFIILFHFYFSGEWFCYILSSWN